MSVRNALVLLLALSTLSLLVGCGSSNNSATAPPTGGFTDSNLTGSYVFSFSGMDYSDTGNGANPAFFAVAGVLNANGSGGFTTGSTIDINDPELGAFLSTTSVQPGLAATGSYKVSSDGRGTGTITVTINGSQVPLGIDFVLSSSSGGLITRFDGQGTGSGTINLQTSGIAQASLQGSYAYGLVGADSFGAPLGTVGAFTLDVNGNATGSEDFNDNGFSSSLTDVQLAPSTVIVGSPSGTAQLNATAGTFSSLGFDVWVIDSTHLKLIETDSTGNVLVGDAFVSTQPSFPSGPLVFTMAGNDINATPMALGGLLTSVGGNTISGGLEDIDDGGSVGQAPLVTGGFSTSGARTTLTLDGLFNGGWGVGTVTTAGNYTFAAYPYDGGIELLEIDGFGGITAGAAYAQTPSSLAASQGYALNLSGANGNGEVDMIAQFSTNTSGGISTGLYDANNAGVLVSDEKLDTSSSAAYSNDSNGDGRGTASFPNLQTNNNSVVTALDLTFYTVNSSTIVFIETDGDQLGVGTLQLQSATGASPAARPVISMVRPAVRSHSTSRKRK
jgi:hypothetical protein